jgi:hypothetical protein
VAPEPSLKLRAEDVDDLAVISACVQDALISIRDFTYDRGTGSFTFVANRFRWEGQPSGDGAPPYERTHCAVSFAAVTGVSYRGFRRTEEDRILSLLAIRAGNKSPGDKPGTIDLEFAGGATVRLGVSAIRVHVTDIGEPWPTSWQPDHAAGEPL